MVGAALGSFCPAHNPEMLGRTGNMGRSPMIIMDEVSACWDGYS